MKLFNDFEKDKCDKPKNFVEVFNKLLVISLIITRPEGSQGCSNHLDAIKS